MQVWNDCRSKIAGNGSGFGQAGHSTTKFNTMNKILNNQKSVNEAHDPRFWVGAVIRCLF